MATSTFEKLTFTILLLDKLSEPAAAVCKSMQKMQKTCYEGFGVIKQGIAGVLASASSLHTITTPAREFEKSLNEVASLGTSADDLDALSKASKSFAMQFGADAASVARSAYDIQSAIPGLAKGALAAFTYQGNMLAKATKADAATITKFQGTMYNIFEKSANKMGQAKWIEALTGKTAYAIKMYKSSGNDMSQAFTNLGSIGQKAGVSLDEQLAVLGTLQGTMGGANAGTAYKAFLNTVGRAQLKTKNGEILKFSDESGKLLPMVKILEKIRAAVGPGQLKLADQTKLMQAFGDEGGKAVLNLLDKTESLKTDIGALGKIQDSNPAMKMAETMVDPYEQFAATIKTLRVTLGQTLLPVINSVLKAISLFCRGLYMFAEAIPPVKWGLAGLVLGFSALTGIYGLIMTFTGVKKIFGAISWELVRIYRSTLLCAGATRSMTAAQKISAIAQLFWNKTLGGAIGWLKTHAFWTVVSAKAQWFWTAVTKKGAFAAALQAVWTKTLAVCNTILTASTKASTGATISQGLAMVWSAAKIALVTAAQIAWKIAIWACHAALVATKAVLLVGAIPAAVAWAGSLAVIKGASLFAAGAMTLLSGALGTAATAAWAFAAALFANPITWIVLAVVALIGALAALIYYWDEVTAFCEKYAGALLLLLGPVGLVIEAFRKWDKIKEFFAGLWEKIKSLGAAFAELGSMIAAPFKAAFGVISGLFSNVGGFISGAVQSALSGIDSLIGGALNLLSKVPGLGFLATETSVETKAPVVPDAVAARKASTDVPAGGIRSTSSTTHNYGGVQIYAANGMSPAQMEEWCLLEC